MHSKIIVIAGPTASGKSNLAVEIAKKYLNLNQKAIIINADSQQVYKELPILSAQPTKEIQKEIPHALYGYLDMSTICSAGIWAKKAAELIKIAWKKNTIPILCGGTGFYLMALQEGLKSIPDIPIHCRNEAIERLKIIGIQRFYEECLDIDKIAARKITPQDKHRLLRLWEVFYSTGKNISWWHKNAKIIKFLPPTIWESYLLLPPREELYVNINSRAEKILKMGAIEEVQRLLKSNIPYYHPLMKALGVQEIKSFIKKESSYEVSLSKLQQYTRNFAKRQTTWFKHQCKNVTVLKSSNISHINL